MRGSDLDRCVSICDYDGRTVGHHDTGKYVGFEVINSSIVCV